VNIERLCVVLYYYLDLSYYTYTVIFVANCQSYTFFIMMYSTSVSYEILQTGMQITSLTIKSYI